MNFPFLYRHETNSRRWQASARQTELSLQDQGGARLWGSEAEVCTEGDLPNHDLRGNRHQNDGGWMYWGKSNKQRKKLSKCIKWEIWRKSAKTTINKMLEMIFHLGFLSSSYFYHICRDQSESSCLLYGEVMNNKKIFPYRFCMLMAQSVYTGDTGRFLGGEVSPHRDQRVRTGRGGHGPPPIPQGRKSCTKGMETWRN